MKTTIINAKIYTANKDMPIAKSMSFEHDKIIAISKNNLEGDQLIDAKGKFVCPSFFDIHMHPLWIAENLNKFACLPPLIYSIEDCLAEIKRRTSNDWILGWGFDEGKIKEHRLCSKDDLDRACTTKPVVIERTCNHICMCNTKALQVLGFDPTHHDGILKETDKFEAFKKIPSLSIEEIQINLKKLSEDCISKGITTISEMLGTPESLQIYDSFNGAVKQTILFSYDYQSIKQLDHLPKPTQPHIKLQGIKILADGSISGQTAWCSIPYKNSQNVGLCTINDSDIKNAYDLARKNHLQLIAHAMGDEAIRTILKHKNDDWLDIPSVRLEHYTITNKELLELTSKNHVAIVSQPIFMYAEIESYLKNLGDEFKAYCYPYKSILNHQIPLAFSSDAPATSWSDAYNPFIGIASSCNRKSYNDIETGVQEKISIQEAIDCYTINAANIVGLLDQGSLTIGKKANFVILNQDLLDLNITIESTKVVETYLNGISVYKSKSL
ncbi:amidohydrolase [Anaerorhabdus furcosa]|uniref:Amidohydrolase 3 domain-containing protein n=1 Tax=Anaerorhabdus furcosa TaxID=118967 RepID=A0A1T4LA40_9FIRM|nr:amidohydrolase family protein [Anaerorhabdus furcosa]SJZ51463.1 hypothetical protein SAMN02745191_0802 [Anaerorhabdus furcosa]